MKVYVIHREMTSPFDCAFYRNKIVGIYSTAANADKALTQYRKEVKSLAGTRRLKKISDGFNYWIEDQFAVAFYLKEYQIDRFPFS